MTCETQAERVEDADVVIVHVHSKPNPRRSRGYARAVKYRITRLWLADGTAHVFWSVGDELFEGSVQAAREYAVAYATLNNYQWAYRRQLNGGYDKLFSGTLNEEDE